MAISLRIGEPSRGATALRVPLPSRVRKSDAVMTERGGFTLDCAGDGRWAVVRFSYDVAAVPAHLPDELQCVVGPHTVAIRLTNELEVASKGADHLTLRMNDGFAFSQASPGPDGVGRVIDAMDRPSALLVCRVEKGMLWAEIRSGLLPGAYRCLIPGREPSPIEILP